VQDRTEVGELSGYEVQEGALQKQVLQSEFFIIQSLNYNHNLVLTCRKSS
jgi:hypothetical protein